MEGGFRMWEKISFAFYRFYFWGDLKVFRKRSSGKLKFSRIFSLFFLITVLHGRQKMRLKRDCKISINTFEKLQVDCCDDPMHHACRCRFLHLRSKSTHLSVDILIKRQIIKKENIQIETLLQR